MASLKEIRSDIVLQLTQAAVSDDFSVPDKQVDFWIGYHLNQLVATECNSKIARSEMIPAVYVKQALDQELEEEGDRVFVELDEEILTLNNDSGVIMIKDQDGEVIKKASVETLALFQYLRFSKPSEDNVLYVRQGNKIYFEGIETGEIPFDTVSVWYVPKQDTLTMTETDELLVSDLVLPDLINLCVERGKLELYGTQPDVAQDGTDTKSVQYHTAIKNPAAQ